MKISKDISVFQFQGLIKAGLSLSHIYFLELIDDDKIVKDIEGYEPYLNELYNLGCLDSNLEITIQGKNLLKEVYSHEDVKRLKNKKKEYDERFLEWWDAYPRSDDFWVTFKEKDSFAGERTLRVKKDECQTKYLELLKCYPHDKMLEAIKYEKEARRDQSYVRNKNMLTYMRSTHPYLNDIENIEKYLILLAKGPYKPQADNSKKVILIKNSY
jgi:hypothetical protein